MKWKWRNDHRSERNLCNCVKKPEKEKLGLQRGLNPWPRDTGAMLYQLSYEATDVGSRSIVGSYVPVKEMSVNDIWNKSYMKSVFRVSRARYEHKGCWENSRQLHNCPEFSQRRTYQATIFNPIRNKIIILDSKIVLFLRAYAIGLAFNCTLISRKKMSFYLFGFPCLWFP